MQAAVSALESYGASKPLLIGVTVLTSTAPEELAETGVSNSLEEQVIALAQLAASNGLDGVVCSAREARVLRRVCDEKFALITPGIRPVGAEKNDQRRIVTPADALNLGASYLVIGRPITTADNPRGALEAIVQSIKQSL